MHFSGVHFNIFNIFKISAGKFSTQDIQPPFQTFGRTRPEGTGYDQMNYMPLLNRLQFSNDIQSGFEDQRNMRLLSMIITYDSSCRTHADLGFKGIFVDRYC
jgi:hypothetical protein